MSDMGSVLRHATRTGLTDQKLDTRLFHKICLIQERIIIVKIDDLINTYLFKSQSRFLIYLFVDCGKLF